MRFFKVSIFGKGGGELQPGRPPLSWVRPRLTFLSKKVIDWLIDCILLQVRSQSFTFIWLDDGAATGQVGAVMWLYSGMWRVGR